MIPNLPKPAENASAAAAVERPSGVRHWVLMLLVLLYGLAYLDRVGISVAAPALQQEFGFDKSVMGFVFAAFSLSYALFQIPTGWLADRIGARRVLSVLVAWWSLFSALTGAVWNVVSLIVVRFLFGMGEAGAFPTASRAIARWMPVGERGFAQGITHTGARLAGALTQPLTAFLIQQLGWRVTFFIFGFVGLPWIAVWWFFFRDEPAQHPKVNALELAKIRAGRTSDTIRSPSTGEPASSSWKALASSRSLLVLSLAYACYGFVLPFFLFWMPQYWISEHGASLLMAGSLSGLLLFTGALTNALGGWISDRLFRRTGRLRASRRWVAIPAFCVAGIGMAGGGMSSSPVFSFVFLLLALAAIELTTGVSWAVALDLGRHQAGTASAIMNTFGNLGATVSPIVFGLMVDHLQSWTAPLFLAAILCLLSAIFWAKIDPEENPFVTPKVTAC